MRAISLCCVVVACGGSSGPATPPPPVVTSVTPGTGLWGAELTIDGTEFGAVQGESKVEFPSPVGANGFVIDTWSDTEITGRVAFPATGAVSVVTAGGDSSATFMTMQPWVPSADLDVEDLAQEIVLSTGDVAALYNEYELTPEPTLAVFSGSAIGAYPLADLVDAQNPTATAVAQVFESDDHSPEVLATKPDGTVGAFTISAGSVTDTATGLTGNVIAVGRDATGLFAWIETETGIELAREGTPWTASAPMATTYPPVGGTVAADGSLWIVVSEPGPDGTTSFVSVERLALGGSAFSAPIETDTMSYPGDITQATLQVASDSMQAIVTAIASGSGPTTVVAPRVRSTSGTWGAAPTLTGFVQFAFFGATLGAVINDSSSSKTTSLVPDATMPAGAQVISVWPAQSEGFAVDGSGHARPIVVDGNVAYALTPSM